MRLRWSIWSETSKENAVLVSRYSELEAKLNQLKQLLQL